MEDGQELQITGHLNEQDDGLNPNDHLGFIDVRIPVEFIKKGEIKIPTLEDEGQRVTVKMSTRF
jgi:hypothetical protein